MQSVFHKLDEIGNIGFSGMAEVPSSLLTGGSIFLPIFFHVVKPSMPILTILCVREKPD